MERLTLYHRGVPVLHQRLAKSTLSIGSHPANDLVLPGDGVAERHIVIVRGPDGTWRISPADEPGRGCAGTALEPGTRVALGPFAVSVEPSPQTEDAGPGAAVDRGAGSHPETACAGDWGLVGTSASTRLLRLEIARFGRLDAPVLVSGETGTGKELVARGFHSASPRSGKAFVPVNCGGLTTSLVEDAFFGHERGAFTGAHAGRKGAFELAAGGILFLDEIGELPLPEQAALLRVLEDKRVRRIGAEEPVAVDFRLVTATNRDLKRLVESGRFRIDLYHRIAALEIATVALRDRPDDIALLASHFLSIMAKEVGPREIDARALARLEAHAWPGNVRELRNALYRAAVRSGRRVLLADDFAFAASSREPKRRSFRLEHVPTADLVSLVEQHGGNVAAAAREIGVPRTSLRDRLRQAEPAQGAAGCEGLLGGVCSAA